jgi:hypothetical protein
MVGIEFEAIVQEFDPKSSTQYDALEQLTLNYPYFPTPWAYLAKAAQVQKKIEADRIIERAAILSYNRAAFKDWMDQELQQPTYQQSESIKNPSPQTKEAFSQEKEVPTTKKAKKKSPLKTETKKATPVAKQPLESRSFLEWLDQHPSKDRAVDTAEKNNNKWDMIDAFIENNPKIPTAKTFEESQGEMIDLAQRQEFVKEELMTETLAKILVQQHKYRKALQAYKILSLKYPEKNTFFASQIKEIKRLQQAK